MSEKRWTSFMGVHPVLFKTHLLPILISIDIPTKHVSSYVFLRRPRSNLDTIWPLHSLFNQRIVPFRDKNIDRHILAK